jgi:CRISPR-associated protein Csm3
MADFPTLKAKIELRGEIVARTGLHIGGPDVGLTIGGADKLVVRAPKDNRPYIPGSSLKGKMRSLLEKAGRARKFSVELNQKKRGEWEARPCKCAQPDCPVCLVFGVPAEDTGGYEPGKPHAGAGRLLVRDSHLTEASAKEMAGWRGLDMPMTESKTEVAIDRLTSQANPRTFERVPAGARFDLDLVLNVYADDDEKELIGLVLDGLELVAHDCLGGQGSRGYGAVDISITVARRLDTAALAMHATDAWSDASLKHSLPVRYPRAEQA